MPSQKTSLTSLALPSIIAIAPSAHAGTHWPQPSHSASSIRIRSLTAIVPPRDRPADRGHDGPRRRLPP